MDPNFWYYLIDGLLNVMFFFLNLLPFHRDWGLSQMFLANMSISILMILSLVGAFIHLQTFFVTMGTVLALETVRAFFALYAWAKELIPLP